MTFEQLCEAGEAADRALAAGNFAAAEEGYRGVFKHMLAAKEVDTYLLAKVALGLLLTYVKRGDNASAVALWRLPEDAPKDLIGLGVAQLAEGVTSANDLSLYNLIIAHLYSLTEKADRSAELAVIDRIMERTVDYFAREQPTLVGVALGNWKRYLIELQDGADDPRRATAWQRAAARSPGVTIGARIVFPVPDLWIPNGEPIAKIAPPPPTQTPPARSPPAARPARTAIDALQRPGAAKKTQPTLPTKQPPAKQPPPAPQAPRAPSRTVPGDFDVVAAGEEADALTARGDFKNAKLHFDEVLAALRRTHTPEPFLAVKAMLGLMVLRMHERNLEGARQIWESRTGDALLSFADKMLGENDRIIPRSDLMIHGMMAMELRATMKAPEEERVDALLGTTAAVLEDAEAVARDRRAMVATNAASLLSAIFAGRVPPELRTELERLSGRPFTPGAITYPRPGPWR